MTCVSWWTWPSRRGNLSSRRGRGADGKENVRRDRRDRDFRALGCGAVAERDVRLAGDRPEDDPEVPGAGGGGGHHARQRAQRAGVGGPGPGVVPAAVGHAAAAGDVAGDRGAPGLHRGADEGRGVAGDNSPAAAGREGTAGQRGERAPVYGGEHSGGGAPVAGTGAVPVPGRAGRARADRLQAAGPLARSRQREAAGGMGVRNGAGLLPAHVRADGAADGPAGVDRVPRRGVRVPRGSRPGLSRTTCGPGSISRICTIRKSTGRMRRWLLTMGA